MVSTCAATRRLELWDTAQPVPATRQTLLFDHVHAGEEALAALHAIAPSSLFEQLFVMALGVAHAAAADVAAVKAASNAHATNANATDSDASVGLYKLKSADRTTA